jgi:lysozyme
MKLSDNGIKLLKQFEGFEAKPYLDAAGIPTIGYGNTFYLDGTPVKMTDSEITQEQGTNLMLNVLVKFENAVTELVHIPLNQNQFDALVLLVYNIGINAFKNSTLLERLNAGLYKDAADQFDRWVYANKIVLKGLVRRRAQEKALFLMPPDVRDVKIKTLETNLKDIKMLEGKKTIIGMLIMLISGLLGAFGIDLGIDWTALETAIGVIVGAAINLYGYFVTKRGSNA